MPLKFLDFGHAEFRAWLIVNDLAALENKLTPDSELKPVDLQGIVFDDSDYGFIATVMGELSDSVKLSLISRFRTKFIAAAGLGSALTVPTAKPTLSSKGDKAMNRGPFQTKAWADVVAANKLVSGRPEELRLEKELQQGNVYTFPINNKTPHGMWFSSNPDGVCTELGLELRSET